MYYHSRMTDASIEKKSSAVSLSDMEIFIFPDLMYSLFLANIMSPRIWRWRNDPWFDGIRKMKPYRRITRVKQFIMNNYTFNLDLETWGLTTKDRELARFKTFIDADILARSNALFGYEGDKYYFDIDIRSHFGLQEYTTDVIPYWKTETVEAMDAFAHKPGYPTGAGECVSLAALYAAAMFIVARIPLSDIFLMATPLHSQNFIDVNGGILTNNRRLVTKNMWFNGTALSAQARRALENERVTLVSHESGHIHSIYDTATISPNVYRHFCKHLRSYLKQPLSAELLGNFLRHTRDLQKCFQLRWNLYGQDKYIGLETVFAYEHGSPYRMNDNTRDKLLGEIEMSEFKSGLLGNRMIINDLEEYTRENTIDLTNPDHLKQFESQFKEGCAESRTIIDAITRFAIVEPRLPDEGKVTFTPYEEPLGIETDMEREEIIRRLEDIRPKNEMAEMAFYVYRDLNRSEVEPFIKAAVERNPVSVSKTEELSYADVKCDLDRMPNISIYDGDGRLAQPDEVWNFHRGDGAEKALLMADVIRNREPEAGLRIKIEPETALLFAGKQTYRFATAKNLKPREWTIPSANTDIARP